jgi:predicted DNA methylase
MPKNAFVNDINSELINLYETIRDDVDVLIEHLRRHKNDSVYFYKIR